MGIAVLGPLELDGTTSTLGLRDRVVLEALVVRPGTVVRAESLAEAIWGETPPTSWPKVVQGCVSRLRKTLGGDVIETTEHGYRLTVHVDHVDHLRFERLVGRARELLTLGEPERASYLLREALDLWRGEPFTELNGWAPGLIELERLVELHRDAEELHLEALLRSGRHQVVLGPAGRLVQEAPFRERRWGLLALAQYQDGRQRDALDSLQRARTVMVSELGLDPGPDLSSLEQAILRQDPSLAVRAALPEPSAVCPYPGLVAYDIRDAGSFFGRESDIEACLAHVDAGGALAIVGASGSGKSSLARAGVAAALERDGRRVRVMAPGRHPMVVLDGMRQRKGDVLVVDQCEEVLAPEVVHAERAAFLAALADIAGRGPLIMTLRADRLGEVSRYPAFAHLVERGLHLLGPMEADALRRAIEGPADQAGLRLEPGLVDLLVREVEGAPGALPLLSHVLRQTWTRREGSTLTVAGYTATGGIQEAVSQSAESVFRGMTARQQGMLRDLMLRLVVPGDSGDPVRTRALRRSVAADEEHEAVIESLVGARLLSSDGDTVEIAHEALAMAWPRLRSWLDDDVEGLRVMRHLAVAADSWEELGRPSGELYRGPRQANAEQWRTGSTPTLTPTERDFLDKSAALADAEARATEEQVRRERRSNQRLRAGLASVAVLLAVSVVAGALAKTAADRADQEATRAEQQTLAADARRLGAEALRSAAPDLALLLAVAGTHLDDSPDARSNLAAVLDRAPELIGVARVDNPITLAVRPDGRAVAVAGWDIGVTLVSTETRKEVARNHDIPFYGVRFNPNGTQLVAAVNVNMPSGERRVDPLPLRMLDPQTAALAPTQLGGLPKGRVVHNQLAFSNNGRWLAAGFIHPTELDEDTWFRVWDTGNLAGPAAAFTLPLLVGGLAVSDDGTRVYTSTGDRVHTLDVAAGREILSAPGTGEIALSPDGSTLAVVRGQQVALLDPVRLTVKSVIEEDAGIGELMFSPTGEQLGYEVGEDTLVVRSLADPDASGVRLSPKVGPGGIGFSPDGRTLYSRGDDRLLVWDLVGDRRFVRSRPVQPQPTSAQIKFATVSPNGQTVANLVQA
ncbi:MAG: BTAD domain-containing putative transcriptional regulator, partial [Pedococcus sp.]